MKLTSKKKLTVAASVAGMSILLVACGNESAEQASVDQMQENIEQSADKAQETIGTAADNAQELVNSRTDAAEDAVDDAEGAVSDAQDAMGDRVEQPANYDADGVVEEGAEADEDLNNTLDEAKQRLESAKEEIQEAQE